MEFVCEKKELQNGVSAVERIVATRSTLPIIGNILFEATKNALKLSANNLEIGVEVGIKANISREGAVLLPAKTLSEMVARLPDSPIGFKLGENGRVRVSYGLSSFTINSLPPDEFPSLPKVKGGKSFSLLSEVLTSMIRQTIFACSSGEEKQVLTGVLVELGKSPLAADSSNLRLVATDGYRLARRGEKVDLAGVGEGSFVVPARALQELSRIIEGKPSEKVLVSASTEQISFQCGNVYLVSRLIAGQFPDYRQVIPKRASIKLVLETEEALHAAERAAVVASGSANITRIEVKTGKMYLTAHTPDVGSIDEVLSAEVKGEEKIQVSFNIRLIIDALKVLNSQKVVFELSQGLSPGLIRPEGGADFIYIVMPIRTQEG
jgi:DNA polymerase-3 subunit beta